MTTSCTQRCIDRVYEAAMPLREDVEYLLGLDTPADIELLLDKADEVRRTTLGDAIVIRAIVEFSNHCERTCAYCGLNRCRRIEHRYRMTAADVLATVERIAAIGIRTVVLQSGEDPLLTASRLAELIERIKQQFDIAVTLSVGERSHADYYRWKLAGADRYLLKIETTDRALYERLHPGMSFDNRLNCLRHLRELDYQTGSGVIVGLPGQTVEMLANDILVLKAGRFDMVSIGPFIPHPDTALAGRPAGRLLMTLKMLALARIVAPDAHMPANTAIGNLAGHDRRVSALCAGANVLMLNCTPAEFAGFYEIYPKTVSHAVRPESLLRFEEMASTIDRTLDYSRGDSLRHQRRALVPLYTN